MRKLCKKCHEPMRRGYTFKRDRIMKYWRCPICGYKSETRASLDGAIRELCNKEGK